MNLEPLEPADLHIGQRIAVSTPFDARLWVKAPDGGFMLSPMSGFGETDSHYWAEVQRLDLHYAWPDLDGDEDLDVLVAGDVSLNVVWYENRVNK